MKQNSDEKKSKEKEKIGGQNKMRERKTDTKAN